MRSSALMERKDGRSATRIFPWVEQFNAASRATEFPVNVATAPDGVIIITGYSEIPVQDGPPRETDTFYTVVKYEPLIAPGSLIANPGFEKDMVSWTLHSNGNAGAGGRLLL
jgi:hypothetical protein